VSHFVHSHGKRIEVDVILPPSRPSRRKQRDTFVKVPLVQAAAITKAVRTPKAMVGLVLLYEAWADKGKTFTLSNKKLAAYGVTHDTKRRALMEMEAAGLITVERSKQRSPIITWVGHTRGCV
jgi:hypothetical protein